MDPGLPDLPSAGLEIGEAAFFEEIAFDSGIDFEHDNGQAGERWFVEMMGAGVGLLDYDNDGDLDVYFVQGGPIQPRESPRPDAAPSDRLYRNDLDPAIGPSSLRFTDVTLEAGLAGATGYGMGVATGDYDRDGDIDIYLCNWGRNQLWRNDGQGGFSDVTDAAGPGIDDPRWSVAASFFDYDRDGWLDLMIVNYDAYDMDNHDDCFSPRSGRLDYCGPQSYEPEPDRLLRNRGDGSFEDVTEQMGLATGFGPALGVVAADLDGDRWTDLYVANDGVENRQWMNKGGKRFVNEAPASGSAFNMEGRPEASMGLLAEDFDGDGDLDLFSTHLERETNTLYLNDGLGRFDDRTRISGLGPASFSMTGFGAASLDVDNDGHLDIAVVNGEVRIIEAQAAAGDPLPLRQPKQLYRGLGGGRFEDASALAGDAFAIEAVGRGLVAGDLDQDGDDDLVVSHNGGPAWLLRNRVGQDRAWIGAQLHGAEVGSNIVGARVALLRGEEEIAWLRVATDGGYASSGDPRVHFGLGDTEAVDGLRVYWPDGTVETWVDPETRRYLALVQGEGLAEVLP